MPPINRVAEIRKRKGWSQQRLAESIGVHWVTISKIERDRQKLTWDRACQIAEALDVDPFELLPPTRRLAQVPLMGEVGGGGHVQQYDENRAPTKTLLSTIYDDPESDWVIVKGPGLYPFFHEGDLLRVTWAWREEARKKGFGQRAAPRRLGAYVGRFCLVEDVGGEMSMGIVSAGEKPGTLDLHCAGLPPRRNVRARAIAQVTVALMPEQTKDAPAGPFDRSS